MTDRTVSVRLRAIVGPYSAAMAKATRDTKELKTSIGQMAKDGDKGFQTMSTGALIAGTGMALGFGKMLTTAASFEKQMSGVRAVSGASADQMDKLSEAAIAAGASQDLAGVSASDAAAAEAELVKAGVSVSDVLNGALMGSLQLASAGQLDFAKSAEIAGQAMNIFDMQGSQVGHVADVLAAAANKSAADVGGLGDSLKQGGLVAAQTGLTFEETAGTFAAFADNALVGSDAGTSFKTMLQRLTPQSAEAKNLMDDLGFSAYDAQGNFIGLEGLAGELQTTLSGMTVEQRNSTMATLFGSDAVRAANILYEEGAEGMEEYVSAVNDQGAAARMAAIQNDNLSGDVEALGGALESAFIENGSKATGALRGITQGATSAVEGFSSMPDLVQTSAMALGGVATAGLLTIGALGTLAPKVAEARKSLDKMGVAGKTLNANLGKIAGGMAVLGAGMAVWGAWETMMADARAEADKFKDSWRGSAMSHATDGLDEFRASLGRVRDEQKKLNDQADSSSAPWDADYRESMRQGADNLADIGDEQERLIDLSDDLAASFGISGDAALEFVMQQQSAGIDVLADDYDAVAESMHNTFRTTTEGKPAAKELGGAMETLGSEIASVEDKVSAFTDSLDVLYGQMFGVEDASDALQSSLNELPDLLTTAKEEGLDLNDALTSQSDAAISVREHMRGMTTEATDLIGKWREQGIEGAELDARIGYLSESFRQQAIDAGAPAPVVDHYLDLLARIPREKSTNVNVSTSGVDFANWQLDNIARVRVAQIQAQVTGSRTAGLQLASGGLVPQYRAAGGVMFQARGTDTVPAMLTPGEFIMRKKAVDQFGLGLLSRMNAGSAASPYAGMTPAGGGGGSTTVINRYEIAVSGVGDSALAYKVRDVIETINRDGY